MFIIWLLSVSGTGNKCRTRDMTIILRASRKKVFIGARSLSKKKKTLQKAKKLFKVRLLSLSKIRRLIFLRKPLEFLPVHSRLQA